MRPRVFLTRELTPGPMARLREHTDLTVNPGDRVLSREELLEGVRGKAGLLCLLTDTIDAPVLDAAPQLKVISNYAVGFNNIDVPAATERGISVTNTPGVLTDTTADMAFALLFATGRRLVEGHDLVRSGGWKGWGPLQLLGGEVTGATLGLIGLGRIGRAMVPRAKGFRMTVLYWNRTRLSPEEEAELGIEYAPFGEVLGRSRFVSIHVAATPETRHLIDARALRLLGPEGYLINTARGSVVDEQALVEALQEGVIAGAGLDVYEREPEVTAGLAACPNAVLAPHLGSATHATRSAMGNIAVDNLLAVLRGDRPAHLINTESFQRGGKGSPG
ncbi:MAG: D-glycerate dehydrogenase [Trueperaceae bacterium]